MSDIIYIFGHKNPDADAICSALAYESYKHAVGQTEYLAARCGNSNARIDAILQRFETPLPPFIGDITPRISNIMQVKARTLRKESTCAEAFELIDQYDVRALPVVNEEGCLEGLISIFQLGEFFIPKPREPKAMRQVHTTVQSIIDSLSANVIHVSNPNDLQKLYVRIAAMDIASFGNHQRETGLQSKSSIIVVGDRQDIQLKCLELGVRLLVITGGLEVSKEVITKAKECNVSLIISPYDSATTSWIIRTAAHIKDLVDPNVSCFSVEDHISSVKRRIANNNDPLYMVINESKELVGVFSKSDILRPSQTRIALVDHNELSQAVNGASEVQITEILDHHKLGNVPTDQPILFINRPVGSTCSIIADLFRSQSITPDPKVAGIMMAGIISDTLLLSSPTTTPLEGELLDWLGPIAGIKPSALADIMFTAGSVIIHNKPELVIRSDCKNYDEGDIKFSVSQIEELGFDNFWKNENLLSDALEAYRKEENLYFSILLITDINTHNSLLLVAGNEELKSSINFPQLGQSNIYELSGIVSRKKQLIPYIKSMLTTMGIL